MNLQLNQKSYHQPYQQLKKMKRPLQDNSEVRIPFRSWQEILTRVLNSPKSPAQSKRRFLQIAPIVPAPAIHCLSPRQSQNSWRIGDLPDLLIKMGCSSEDEANDLKRLLFEALSVGTDDDIWARILQSEFEASSPTPDIVR